MYTGALELTNNHKTPFALSNNFNDTFGLTDSVKKCKSSEEFCNVVNKYHNYKYVWHIYADYKESTILAYTDALGNRKYLIAMKETNDETIEEYKERLIKKIHELKRIDRSKNFSEKELVLIDKVYNSVLQVIEFEL